MSIDIKSLAVNIQKKCYNVLKCSNSANIVIKNNEMFVLDKGNLIFKRQLTIKNLKESFNNILYSKVLNISDDTRKYSPLEADREVKSSKYTNTQPRVWKDTYNNIVFPRFNVVMFLFVAFTGRMPSVEEFCETYIELYTEETNEVDSPYNDSLFIQNSDRLKGRSAVGNEIKMSSGKSFVNKLLKFKKGYLINIPTNAVTTEQIIVRATKAYGSLIRDFYAPVVFNYVGAKTYYSLKKDTDGVDLYLNGIPCFSYVGIGKGKRFAYYKQTSRHDFSDIDCAIHLIADITPEYKDKLFYMNEETARKIVNESKSINGDVEYHY